MKTWGIVYFFDTGVGIKIGKTRRPLDQRMKEISPFFRLRFIHAIAHDNHAELERALHQKFTRKRVFDLPSREIFALTFNDMLWVQSIDKFGGLSCKHLTSLMDAIRYSIIIHKMYRLEKKVKENSYG